VTVVVGFELGWGEVAELAVEAFLVEPTWGEDRVFFFGENGTQKSLPRAWTDAADVDVFVALAAGRCPFRIVDLLVLTEIVDGLRLAESGAASANETSP
jgi:hypothetical protein